MEQYKWEYFLDVVIIEILKYLLDEEKVKVVLICKNWGWFYYILCLWWKRYFDVGGY